MANLMRRSSLLGVLALDVTARSVPARDVATRDATARDLAAPVSAQMPSRTRLVCVTEPDARPAPVLAFANSVETPAPAYPVGTQASAAAHLMAAPAPVVRPASAFAPTCCCRCR